MQHLPLTIIPLVLLCCCNCLPTDNQNVLMFEAKPISVCGRAVQEVTFNLSTSFHVLDRKYLSLAMSPHRITNKYSGAQKLINLAAALAPADARVGGTAVNFMTFTPPTSDCQLQPETTSSGNDDLDFEGGPQENFTFSGQQWESFTTFLAQAHWDLLFDLNNFMWTGDHTWDTTNVDQLLQYSSSKNIRIPYFQIGNEPSNYSKFKITDKELVENYKTLRKLLSRYTMYRSSKLCGPDVSNVGKSIRARNYLNGFVANGAYNVVDELSVHFYYLHGATATISDFLSVDIMNTLRKMLDTAVGIIDASPRQLPLRLTETASASGGGAPGLSDRYAGGFLWLDKLGLCAKYPVTRVFRQTFSSGAYAIIGDNYDPRPDYYLSLVFKKLVEGPVLSANLKVENKNLRVYANCARRDVYAPGALVLYFVNVADIDAVISLPQFPGADLDLYLLTPGDLNGLTSRYVKLNGVKLQMSGDNLPPINPHPHTGDVTIDARTYGFIVVPGANVSLCVNYFNSLDLTAVPE